MPAPITLKIDADTAAYIAKISQMAMAHEKVNKPLGESGSLLGKMTGGLERSLFKAVALHQVVTTIAEGFKRASANAEELSKKIGESAVKTSTNLATLGIKGNRLAAAQSVVEQDTGVASLAESEAFVASLAKSGKKLTEKQLFQAVNAFKRGGDLAFGPGGELLSKGIAEGKAGSDIDAYANRVAAERLGVDAGPGAIERGLATTGLDREFDIRAMERANEIRLRAEANLSLGANARLAAGQRAIQAQQSPIAAAVAEKTVIGDVILQKLYESSEGARLEDRRKILANDSRQGE